MNFANHNILGPDVSFYQDNDGSPQQIDFQRMKAAGARFVVIRAGQGNYIDTDFAYNWREAKAAGIPRGSYWFYDSRVGPQYQAEKWWSLIGNDPGELPCFLDLEEKYGGDWSSWHNWYDFLAKFQSLSKLPDEKIGIYTGFYYWTEHAPVNVINLEWFRRFPLWLAWYGLQTDAKVPPPWDSCLFWQYGTPPIGIAYGVESIELDMNLFNGDEDKFKTLFNLTNTSQPPDGGLTMARYEGTAKLTSTPNVRIRKTYPDGMTIGALQPGQSFEGDRIETDTSGTKWMHITKAGATVIDGWSAVYLLNYVDNGEPVPEPPPATEIYLPAYIVAHFPNGETKRYNPE